MLTLIDSLDPVLARPEVRITVAGLLAATLTWLMIPAIIRASKSHNLTFHPNERSSHHGDVPRLGGIGIFGGIFFSIILFGDFVYLHSLKYVAVGMMIILFLGIKDDISTLSWYLKLIGQVAACLVVIIPGHMYFTSIHGFLGFSELYTFYGITLTLFVMIVIINSYNLIDGIDGLAAGLGMLAAATFGIYYYLNGDPEKTLIASAMFFALGAFLYFNVFSKRYKIFMGDTGSLLIGFIVAYFVIGFCELNKDYSIPYHLYASPAVAMGILAVPLFDTLRVFFIRALRNESPFHADKRHLHHFLLDMGLSHGKASLVLVLWNMACIGIAIGLDAYTNSVIKLTLILLLSCMLFTEILNQIVFIRKRRARRRA